MPPLQRGVHSSAEGSTQGSGRVISLKCVLTLTQGHRQRHSGEDLAMTPDDRAISWKEDQSTETFGISGQNSEGLTRGGDIAELVSIRTLLKEF